MGAIDFVRPSDEWSSGFFGTPRLLANKSGDQLVRPVLRIRSRQLPHLDLTAGHWGAALNQ